MQGIAYILHRLRAPLMSYGAAVLLTMLALLLRLLLAPLLGDRALLLLFFVPVVLSAWYGGFGPGLLAIALSVLAGAYFILPSPYAFLTDRSNLVMVGLFVLQGLLLTGLSALIRTRTLALRAELTERRRVEAALRESEARYRSLVETSPDAIVLTDLTTTILFCNHQAARLYGCARVEELIGRRGVEFIVPEDRQCATDSLQRTLASGSISNIEYTLLKQDGTQFPAEVSASVIVDADGQPAALLAVVRDISERKQAEQALQRQALHDALTDLPNRALFLDRLGHALAHTKRHPTDV